MEGGNATFAAVCVLPVVVLLIALALPAPASAWTLDRLGDTLLVSGDAGETNSMTVDFTANPPVVRDTSAAYRDTSTSCGPTADGADCGGLISHAVIGLGDGDDVLEVIGEGQDSSLPTSVDGGPGKDSVLGGPGSNRFSMRDGERDTIACDPPGEPDWGGQDYVVADDDDAIALDCERVVQTTQSTPTAIVTTAEDEDDRTCDASCSVRDAVAVVQRAGRGTVALPAGTFVLGDTLQVYTDVTIRGAGARATTLRQAGGGTIIRVAPRLIYGWPYTVPAAALADLRMQGGPCDAQCGTLVVNDNSALTISRSAIVGGRARDFGGGGIDSSGTLVVEASTIAGNTVDGGNPGGGILSLGSLAMVDSTISGNSAGAGAGIAVFGTARVLSTTFAHNTPGAALDVRPGATAWLGGSVVTGGCSGAVASLGGNVENGPTCGLSAPADTIGDPLLGPLRDNGGPTDTHALGAGSAALDAAGACVDISGAPLLYDQRGVTRPQGAACDAGAVEELAQSSAPTIAPAPDRLAPRLSRLRPSVRRATLRRMQRLVLRFTLTEPALVRIALHRGTKRRSMRVYKAHLEAGRHALRIGRWLLRRPLKPGAYVLAGTAKDGAGNRSAARTVQIRILRPGTRAARL